MSDEVKAISKRGHRRALGKILRDLSIERREAYFDLLVSGYSIEQIAGHMKKSPSAVRRVVGQALAKRRLDAPEDYASIQVARLTKALRCADVSLEEGDLKAIAPFVKVVRELNLYHGVNVGPARLARNGERRKFALRHGREPGRERDRIGGAIGRRLAGRPRRLV